MRIERQKHEIEIIGLVLGVNVRDNLICSERNVTQVWLDWEGQPSKIALSNIENMFAERVGGTWFARVEDDSVAVLRIE